MPTVGFASSNWSWGPDGKRTRCMGASLYYRGGLAAAYFQAAGLGGWVGERFRSRPDGTGEVYGQDREWHAPDVLWTELIGCTADDLEATHRARAAGQIVVGDLDDDVWQVPNTNDAHSLWVRELAPLGLRLLAYVLDDFKRGTVAAVPQDEDLASWYPAIEGVPRLKRPDLLQLGNNGLELRRTL